MEYELFHDDDWRCRQFPDYRRHSRLKRSRLSDHRPHCPPSRPGLDFAFTNFDKDDPSSLTLQFSMPLHDMFKENCGPGFGKRRVGYIMLTRRIKL
jgi:hypothetical protein